MFWCGFLLLKYCFNCSGFAVCVKLAITYFDYIIREFKLFYIIKVYLSPILTKPILKLNNTFRKIFGEIDKIIAEKFGGFNLFL